MKKPPPKEHTWQKGRSPNPGGRPKDFLGLRSLARSHAPDAIQTLVKIMTGRYPAAARVQAATAILDRGFGKPQLHVEADLRVEAVRVLAGTDFDAKVVQAVARLGRTPEGASLLPDQPLEPLETVADNDEAEDLDLPGSFREIMHELKSGRPGSSTAAGSTARKPRIDRLEGYRDSSDGSSIEPP